MSYYLRGQNLRTQILTSKQPVLVALGSKNPQRAEIQWQYTGSLHRGSEEMQ